MTVADFTRFLVAEIEAADGDTTWVEQLLTDAKAKITAGQGDLGTLINSGLNGKSFTRQLVFSAADVAAAARAALDQVEAESAAGGSLSYADFSMLR